jgi:DNA-binding XRE family transcriptional regulator
MFKDNLVYLRKMKGMSQENLAARLDITRQTI